MENKNKKKTKQQIQTISGQLQFNKEQPQTAHCDVRRFLNLPNAKDF